MRSIGVWQIVRFHVARLLARAVHAGNVHVFVHILKSYLKIAFTRSSLKSSDSWGNHNLEESFTLKFHLIESPNLINKGRLHMSVITVACK